MLCTSGSSWQYTERTDSAVVCPGDRVIQWRIPLLPDIPEYSESGVPRALRPRPALNFHGNSSQAPPEYGISDSV